MKRFVRAAFRTVQCTTISKRDFSDFALLGKLCFILMNASRSLLTRCFFLAQSSDSEIIGKVALQISVRAHETLHSELPSQLRQLVSDLQPREPITQKKHLPKIDVMIPIHPKDVALLPFVLEGVGKGSNNPLGRVILVTPNDNIRVLKNEFPWCEIRADQDVLETKIINCIDKWVPPSRRGWVTQQLLKIYTVIQSDAIGCLVVDADTVLLKPRTWIDSFNVQLICMSYENHAPYHQHFSRVWGSNNHNFPLSFVTHHQLMQPEFVRAMFNDGARIEEWLSLADWTNASPISEYESYGFWMVWHHPSRLKIGKWSNVALPYGSLKDRTHRPITDVETLEGIFPSYNSVSFHSYLT